MTRERDPRAAGGAKTVALAGSRCEAIAVGGSAGALGVVLRIVEDLPARLPIPVFLCLHLHPDDDGDLARLLSDRTRVTVTEAGDKMRIEPGRIHVAPANYHLLVERSRTLALSSDHKVRHCRPSIDVLFESAARAYAAGLVAILLSGANDDGAAGMASVKARGGVAVVQDPSTAESPVMPRSAIDSGGASLVLSPHAIREFVSCLVARPARAAPVQATEEVPS